MKIGHRAAALLAALGIALAGCGGTEQQRYQAQFLTLFDTVTTIIGYGGTKEEFTETAQWFHDELEAYHRLYDIYHDYPGTPNLKTVNDNAGVAPVAVDRRVLDLLAEARALYGETGGKVNVAFGSVLAVWHDYRTRGIDDPASAELPPMERLREAALHTDIEDMILDEEAGTVYLRDPEMRLDVGAVAKGYAVQRVCDSARARGTGSLLVSVGGNVCAVGEAAGERWRVGVQDPKEPMGSTDYLCVVGLRDETLVTSGGYQRRYTVGGKTYHHIIDPDTLMPANHSTAVSVLAGDSGRADALSTALYNLPVEDGMELVGKMRDVDALWVLPDGSWRATNGFKQHILNEYVQ